MSRKDPSTEGINELIPAPRWGRDELNLCEFPFAVLGDRVPEDVKTLEFSDTIRGPEGQIITRKWTVTGSDKFGLPVASDELVYLALMEITKERGFEDRQVPFTRYEVARRLHWAPNGENYRRIEAALDRLRGVSIKAENAFWDRRKNQHVTVGFGLLSAYALFEEPPGRKKENASSPAEPTSYIIWNEVIFASMQAGYIKQIDLNLLLELRNNTARRLYRYLDKKRLDGKRTFQIGLRKLAYHHLSMPASYSPSQIKQKLERAHAELIDCGFLQGVRYEDSHKEPLVIYTFTPPARVIPPQEPLLLTRTDREENAAATAPETKEMSINGTVAELLQALIDTGITETVARRLVAQHPEETIRQQLDTLPYRPAEDPAALLVKAITENWAPPKPYQQAQEAAEQKRQQDEATRRKADAAAEAERERQERQERIDRIKATLSPEEREELFEEALQAWAPGTQHWHRERGIDAPSSQALLDQWMARKYLGEEAPALPA